MNNLTIWILLIPMVSGFFHEISQTKIINFTLPEKSLFGYSTAYLPSSKSLIVSAPNADDIGRLYLIALDSGIIEQIIIVKATPKTGSHGMWLGATVKSIKDYFVACAPRYTRLAEHLGKMKMFETGVCNIVKSGRSQVMPDISPNDRKINTKYGWFEERMDTFGWSLDITPNEEILVGGPGMTGRAAIYEPSRGTRLIYDKNISENRTYNFGYSVVGGNFADKMQYAVTSTYGTNGFGKIYFYDSSFNNVETIVDQEAVGSMFGAALCAVDLGADHDHLLVGAPVHSETYKYDVGAVYLYATDSKYDNKMIFRKKISGTTSGGYFGNTIITLGDLDGDGKDEVAIAAPYEDDYQGAVYIYTGYGLADIDSNNVPIQKITPKDKLRYFGFSLTALQDYDGNGCNALAIGTPGSNNVVLFRSFASVKITIEANLIKIIRENKTSVEFESCLEVTYPEKPQKIIGDIIVKVAAPNGLYSIINATNGTLTYTVSLNKALPRHCRTHTISLHKNLDLQTVMYEINAELEIDPRNFPVFNPSQVIPSSQSTLSKSGQFSITDCDGEICKPVLKIDFSSSMPGGNYAIGSSDSEWFSLSVTNEGDVAYDPCIELGVSGASILQYPSTCTILKELDAKRIICSPRMALNNEHVWSIDRVLLETKDMTSSDQTMEIRYDVYNHCNNQTEKSSYSKKIILQSDTLFLLTGAALPEQNINIPTSELSQPRIVNHLYKIKNNGLTNWVGVKIKIELPEVLVDLTNVPYQITIIKDEKKRECPMDIVSSSDEFSTIMCDLGDLLKTKEASVYITINIIPESLGLTKDSSLQLRTLTSNLHFLFETHTESQSISTTIQRKSAQVPLWIIIVALCVGLLILFIIAFVLYKRGFLRRENKAKLKDLKQSYRQSTRRPTRASDPKGVAGDEPTLIALKNK